MGPLVDRYEIVSAKAQGDSKKEALVDAVSNSWYLEDVTEDLEAIAQFDEDLRAVEKKVLM